VEFCEEELQKLERTVLELATLVDVPGGPSLRFRVSDQAVRAVGDTADGDTPPQGGESKAPEASMTPTDSVNQHCIQGSVRI
jgi:hypothetical protein